jgi:hypothetical protein
MPAGSYEEYHPETDSEPEEEVKEENGEANPEDEEKQENEGSEKADEDQ